MKKRSTISGYCILVTFLVLALSPALWAREPLPMPDYDPAWSEVKALWDQHWDGKNLDVLIERVAELETKYPDRVEPCLWLGKLYNLKGRWDRKNPEYFKQAEAYAVKARKLDPHNRLAFELMAISVTWHADVDYALKTYPDWFEEMTPFPSVRVLPDMPQYPEWKDAVALWDEFADHEKAKKAITIFQQIADAHPDDALAQTWASRSNYHVGEYYTSLRRQDEAMPFYNRGMSYGERAIKLTPNSSDARYWYEVSLSRSIQFASPFKQLKHLNTISDHVFFCEIEDPLINFCGPCVGISTMITEGGWVAEKGMALMGFKTETSLQEIRMAEILYPDYIYMPFSKADLMAYMGQKEAALAVADKALQQDINRNHYCAGNNSHTIHDLKRLQAKLSADK